MPFLSCTFVYGPIRLIIVNRSKFGKSVANPWTLADHDHKSKNYLDRTILCSRNNPPCTLIVLSCFFCLRLLSHFTFRYKLSHTVSNQRQVRRYLTDITRKSFCFTQVWCKMSVCVVQGIVTKRNIWTIW